MLPPLVRAFYDCSGKSQTYFFLILRPKSILCCPMQISKIFLSLTLLFGIFSLDTAHALDETRLYRGVLQIRSYSYDPASGLYILASYGSSVSLG